MPYAVGLTLFLGMIPMFPVAGAFGGFLSREFSAEPKLKKQSGEKRRGFRARR
jgi:hypothetical protein